MDCRVMSAISMAQARALYCRRAIRHLEGAVLSFFAAGTGNPYYLLVLLQLFALARLAQRSTQARARKRTKTRCT